MSQNWTAEQFAQRIYECRLLENRQIDEVFSELGGRGVELDLFISTLSRKELLTNWQTTRLLEGHRRGYIYGNWKVLYLVGAGTFARVYRATHRKTNDIMAVKVLRNRYANDLDTQERFMDEAQTVMKLKHPNIVPIHEVKTEQGRTYMVMDFIEGQNLRDFVKTHGKLALMTALNITRDLASGLRYALQQGVTHRDMKLSNVLLSTNGRANIVDFGLAVIDDKANVGEGFNPRSVDYAGLEKTTNVPRNDKRSDIFFLGCMLYHMLSGQPPLEETRERMRRMSSARFRNIPPISSLVPNLPHGVVVVLNRLMELKPDERIQTPAEALNSIEKVIRSIKSGKHDEYSEEQSKRDAREFERRARKATEGVGHTVMVVDSHSEVQNLMRERLKGLGYRVLILSDPIRAIQRFENLDPAEDRPAHCVIFGCAGLGQMGLQAFNEFAVNEWTKDTPAILLVRESQADFRDQAKLSEKRVCGNMPIKFRRIRKHLQELLEIDEDKDHVEED